MTDALVDVYVGCASSWLGDALHLLTADDMCRAARHIGRPTARRFIAGRALMHVALSLEGQQRRVCLDVIRHCEDCGKTGHGRPRVSGAELFVSSSRAGDIVVVGVTQAGPLGIDIARWVSPIEVQELRDEVLSPRERDYFDCHAQPSEVFTAIWARKEAVLKAVGTGIGDSLSALDVLDARVPAAKRDGTVHWVRVASSKVFRPVGFAAAVVDAEDVNLSFRFCGSF